MLLKILLFDLSPTLLLMVMLFLLLPFAPCLVATNDVIDEVVVDLVVAVALVPFRPVDVIVPSTCPCRGTCC